MLGRQGAEERLPERLPERLNTTVHTQVRPSTHRPVAAAGFLIVTSLCLLLHVERCFLLLHAGLGSCLGC